MKPLPLDFYLRDDVVEISRDLLGKILFTKIDGHLTGGRILETEAYKGPEDRASHAYKGRRTKRTEVMFHRGGICYVYLCYGIHYLLNFVTNKKEIPHAVLIRAVEPLEGIGVMLKRRKKIEMDRTLTNGPGSLARAFGIDYRLNGVSLNSNKIWVEEGIRPINILAGTRIGVDYAGADALLNWRFWI